MIRAITIDDEPLALKLLEVYISRIDDLHLVASCPGVDAARPFVRDADVIFVDINMPDMNGMEFVRSLEDPPLIVFTTAYAEHAVEGFRVNAVDYLVKPFAFEDFKEAVDRVRHMLELKARPEGIPEQEKVIFFQVGHQRRRVCTADIMYVESMGAYLMVHIAGEDPLIVLGNFKSILDADPERFFRIHKSYVINLEQIRQSGRSSVTLIDGTVLSVGESYRKAFRECLRQ
ncbi:MAG: response regulator transcription factor [Bacteroidales bacterium]|nr:response regulator transcription factor [Bacteroidales bacterium]